MKALLDFRLHAAKTLTQDVPAAVVKKGFLQWLQGSRPVDWSPALRLNWLFLQNALVATLAPIPTVLEPHHANPYRFLHRFPGRPESHDRPGNRGLEAVSRKDRCWSWCKLRASQINGCAFCLDMHTADARKGGETERRLYTLSAWRETPFFTHVNAPPWSGPNA